MGHYARVLMDTYNQRMAAKMGLRAYQKELSIGLLEGMYEDQADFTNAFRSLADVSVNDAPDAIPESLRAVSALTLSPPVSYCPLNSQFETLNPKH